MKSPQQGADRYKSGMGSAGPAYEQGVASTTIDVMGRAIQAAPVAIRNYQEALSSGRYAAAINASGGTANWKAKTQQKSGNYTGSATYAGDNYAKAASKLYPAIESIVSGLSPRVSGDVAGNVQRRVLPLAQQLHASKGTFKG